MKLEKKGKPFECLDDKEISMIKSQEFKEDVLGYPGKLYIGIYILLTIVAIYFLYNYHFESQSIYLNAKETVKNTYGSYIFCASSKNATLFLSMESISKNFSLEKQKKCREALTTAHTYDATNGAELIENYAVLTKSTFQTNQMKNIILLVIFAVMTLVVSLKPIEVKGFSSSVEVDYTSDSCLMISVGETKPMEEISEHGALYMIDVNRYGEYYVLTPQNPNEEPLKAVMKNEGYDEFKKFLSQFKNIAFKSLDDKWEVIYIEFRG